MKYKPTNSQRNNKIKIGALLKLNHNRRKLKQTLTRLSSNLSKQEQNIQALQDQPKEEEEFKIYEITKSDKSNI